MAKHYTQDELWRIYRHLPPELKTAIFSAETADSINNTCARNGIPEEIVPAIARQVGNVLMGLTIPSDFEKALVKEAKIRKSLAQNIAKEITRLVFYPVKPQLEQIHKEGGEIITEIPTPRHGGKVPVAQTNHASQQEEIEEETVFPVQNQPQAKRSAKDLYREPVEEEGGETGLRRTMAKMRPAPQAATPAPQQQTPPPRPPIETQQQKTPPAPPKIQKAAVPPKQQSPPMPQAAAAKRSPKLATFTFPGESGSETQPQKKNSKKTRDAYREPIEE